MKIGRIAIYAAVVLILFSAGVRQADAVISTGTPISLSSTVFVVPIQITDGVNVIFWEFDLTYDPAVAQINTACDPFSGDSFCSLFTGPVTEGPFFGSLSSFNVFNPGFILLDGSLQQAGTLLAVNDTFGGDLPGPSGDGILAYVEFVTVGQGDPQIAVTSPTVTSQVPEPATLALFASGLALLGAGGLARRRKEC